MGVTLAQRWLNVKMYFEYLLSQMYLPEIESHIYAFCSISIRYNGLMTYMVLLIHPPNLITLYFEAVTAALSGLKTPVDSPGWSHSLDPPTSGSHIRDFQALQWLAVALLLWKKILRSI